MIKQTVFIKVDVKDRLPSEEDLIVYTDMGKSFVFDVPKCKWWLEEIELDLPEKVHISYQEVQDDSIIDGSNYC